MLTDAVMITRIAAPSHTITEVLSPVSGEEGSVPGVGSVVSSLSAEYLHAAGGNSPFFCGFFNCNIVHFYLLFAFANTLIFVCGSQSRTFCSPFFYSQSRTAFVLYTKFDKFSSLFEKIYNSFKELQGIMINSPAPIIIEVRRSEV